MKLTIIAALAATLSLATAANAEMGGSLGTGLGGDTIPRIDWMEFNKDAELRLCAFYGNLTGACSRHARKEGITLTEAKAQAKAYREARK